jgi:hypothetical protein
MRVLRAGAQNGFAFIVQGGCNVHGVRSAEFPVKGWTGPFPQISVNARLATRGFCFSLLVREATESGVRDDLRIQ